MSDKNNETPESLPEEGEPPETEELPEEPEVVSEDEKTPESAPQDKPEKTVPYERFQEVNAKLAELKKQLGNKEFKTPTKIKSETKSLDVDDLIDISASLQGLDQREQEYLARQHKLTGLPLKDIRESEDYKFWQSAYRIKVEKDKSLSPSSTQPDAKKPKTMAEKLANASLEEKEKILTEAGLWQNPRRIADKRRIGI